MQEPVTHQFTILVFNVEEVVDREADTGAVRGRLNADAEVLIRMSEPVAHQVSDVDPLVAGLLTAPPLDVCPHRLLLDVVAAVVGDQLERPQSGRHCLGQLAPMTAWWRSFMFLINKTECGK